MPRLSALLGIEDEVGQWDGGMEEQSLSKYATPGIFSQFSAGGSHCLDAATFTKGLIIRMLCSAHFGLASLHVRTHSWGAMTIGWMEVSYLCEKPERV